ncbi:MAG TPA: sugar ABC transporter permease [Firmicutes bacterium]|nr:sugar ABC transporter permease [Bacillota bacterium]
MRSFKEKIAPYVLLSPYLFMLIVFFGYAFVRCLYFSFTDYDLFSPPQWVGLKNYLNLFRDFQFGLALKNSIQFAIIVTFAQTAFALLLAIVLNQKIKGIQAFRAAYYMPSIASSAVVTLVFIWLFQKRGLINYLLTVVKTSYPIILTFIGIALLIQAFLVYIEKVKKRPVSFFEPSFLFLSLAISFLVTYLLVKTGVVSMVQGMQPVETVWLNTRKRLFPKGGIFSIPYPLGSIMLLNTWTTAPTFMLLYLAGLQDIPKELYEAAAVDGATKGKTFWYIVIPQLRNITFLVVTMGLIGTIQMFDQVAFVGEQAPSDAVITLAYYVYINAFPSSLSPKIGMASAAAVFLGLLTLLIVLIQKKVVDKG